MSIRAGPSAARRSNDDGTLAIQCATVDGTIVSTRGIFGGAILTGWLIHIHQNLPGRSGRR